MIEAVYISDTNNNLVYEYLTNLASANFNSLINIINDRQGIVDINANQSVYLYPINSIVIYTLVDNKVNPVLPYVFIFKLMEVIHDYFGKPIAIHKIESNNDTLTLLIDQMLDDGIPNITDFNKLRDIVPFKSFLSKILSKTNEITNATITKQPPLEVLPWRRSDVKYTNNEMYVDIIETVNVILKNDKKKVRTNLDSAFYSTNTFNGKLVPITGNIQGKINFLSHLTGLPHLQLSLNHKIDGSYHQCVENTNSSVLKFIPPDGSFELCNYCIDLNELPKNQQLSSLGQVNVEYNYGLGKNKNEFEIKLYLPIKSGVSKIENLSVEIHLNFNGIIKSSRLTHGDFQFKGNNKAEWNLRTISMGINPILYGSIIGEDKDEDDEEQEQETSEILKPNYIKLIYSNKGCVPSGLKVENLKLLSSKGMPETVKPFKGVKYITKTGDYVVRS
ncbi:AP-3 complex subunit mu [[Candida] jaroonii]|uniref:AP-3 complex subunit mu n=1 Tax=[Candida] jaroonii TaxID=467808 RepID=A0ACA9Y4B9_9ASCO|nr:AP-3 complex subunit mu [[Candida] jaroonii]